MDTFNMTVWRDAQIYLVDFGRASSEDDYDSTCPDVDRYGYMDDRYPSEHGPIMSACVIQEQVKFKLYRTEISSNAKLYALPQDGKRTIELLDPTDGRLPDGRTATISFKPKKVGRTAVEIHYQWPDGPVIGRLYVDVRAVHDVNCRFHMVTLNGSGFGNPFLLRTCPTSLSPAAQDRFRVGVVEFLITQTNHVLLPHGIRIVNRSTVNTAWTNALFPAPTTLPGGKLPAQFKRIMYAMAHSPNRHKKRVNVFLVDWTKARASANPPPFEITFAALGPPVAWARNLGMVFPRKAKSGHVGSGVIVNTAQPITGAVLAHEFGHVFHLSSITSKGQVKQWHTIGDPKASRDDFTTRRRVMYSFMNLPSSNYFWRHRVGYGTKMGQLLTQRRAVVDTAFEESLCAYKHAVPKYLYAP